MARKEMIALYAASLVQGVALVAFPAASSIFTNEYIFNFSFAKYGSLFIPQTVFAILLSFLSPKLTRLLGTYRIFLTGLFANLASILLLGSSALVFRDTFFAYLLLMIATSALGIGFGLTVPTINMAGGLFFPQNVDRIILVLNALLGTGTALAPFFTAIFIEINAWWGYLFF